MPQTMHIHVGIEQQPLFIKTTSHLKRMFLKIFSKRTFSVYSFSNSHCPRDDNLGALLVYLIKPMTEISVYITRYLYYSFCLPLLYVVIFMRRVKGRTSFFDAVVRQYTTGLLDLHVELVDCYMKRPFKAL